jgi:H+/Cl- antiporter ClcA
MSDESPISTIPHRVTETGILIISTLKWSLLAAIVGSLVGIATTIFLKTLEAGINLAHNLSWFFLPLPLALLFSTLLVRLFAPDAEGHGTEIGNSSPGINLRTATGLRRIMKNIRKMTRHPD